MLNVVELHVGSRSNDASLGNNWDIDLWQPCMSLPLAFCITKCVQDMRMRHKRLVGCLARLPCWANYHAHPHHAHYLARQEREEIAGSRLVGLGVRVCWWEATCLDFFLLLLSCLSLRHACQYTCQYTYTWLRTPWWCDGHWKYKGHRARCYPPVANICTHVREYVGCMGACRYVCRYEYM